MIKPFFTTIVLLMALSLFSQGVDSNVGEIKFTHHVTHLKYKGNDTIYFVDIFIEEKDTIVLKKYIKLRKKLYYTTSGGTIIEIGKFRNNFLYNSPFEKVKIVEKTGKWKEYDSLTNTLKTNNRSVLKGGIKRVRLFPRGEYYYFQRPKNKKSDK